MEGKGSPAWAGGRGLEGRLAGSLMRLIYGGKRIWSTESSVPGNRKLRKPNSKSNSRELSAGVPEDPGLQCHSTRLKAAALIMRFNCLFWFWDDSRVSRLVFYVFLSLRLFTGILIRVLLYKDYFILFSFLFSCFKLGLYCNCH